MLEQRSDAWFAIRLGKVTASCISKVMTKTKSGYSADRDNYAAQLLSERFTGRPYESFTNGAMQWGVDTEAQARDAYSEHALCIVTETGFADHPAIPMAGASPDGLIGDDGLVEIKCPNTATHIRTLRGAPIDRKYVLQMQFQMACTGREWCDFASFDPRLHPRMQLHVRRVPRDAELITEIEAEVVKFLAEIDEAFSELTTGYLEREAA